jgi:hypothetical protein
MREKRRESWRLGARAAGFVAGVGGGAIEPMLGCDSNDDGEGLKPLT